jgi:hypothetical protein
MHDDTVHYIDDGAGHMARGDDKVCIFSHFCYVFCFISYL